MGWRSIMVSRPARLSRHHFSLAIVQDETVYIPFEDIAIIVLDSPQVTLTHPVLSACAEYGIGLFSTDDSHHPSGIFLPFLPHSKPNRMFRLQLSLPRPVAKRTWATIVRSKINNQGKCLCLMECGKAKHVLNLVNHVRSGDSTMVESKAAALYFKLLYGSGFHRNLDCWQNSALNYGYTIIRASIARALVAHGFFPPLGLHHDSEQNAFNLADDLIEPFRAIVDLFVVRNFSDQMPLLSKHDKAGLVSLLNLDVCMPTGITSVLTAIEKSVESLGRVLISSDDSLIELPEIIGLREHATEG